MNPKKLSKKEAETIINEIFSKKYPSSREIKKAKRLAMAKNIKLRELRKKFCKKCLIFFTSSNCEIRIKMPFKIVKCLNCGYVSRYKLKNESDPRTF